MGLPFYDVFPCDVDVTRDIPQQMGKIFWEIVRREPILDLPDLESVQMYGIGNHGGDILPRSGSVVHARWSGRKTPVLVTGGYGEGATLQLDQGWHNIPTESLRGYRYAPDLIYNQLYFVADVSPPDDLELAHRTREMFIDVRTRKVVTISTIEFVDKFGAKVTKVEGELAQLDSEVREAERIYLAGDYLSASEMLRKIMEEYPGIESGLTRMKKNTLLWIYVSEWLAVLSTGMVCGVVVWALMVRRRLYREAGVTRLSPRLEDD